MSPATRFGFSRLEVGRRQDDAPERGRGEVLDRLAQPGHDPVGVGLTELLRPRSVSHVELPGGVALDGAGRELLELDPDDRLPVRRPRRVDRARLAGDDGRLGGEQPALGLVDRARDAVEPGGHVDDRGPREALRVGAFPARRLVEGEVDLHPGAAVAIALRGRVDVLRGVARAEEAAVELGRGDSGDDGAGRGHGFAVGQDDTRRTTRRDRDPFHARSCPELSAGIANDPGERVDEPHAAADRHGHAPELDRAGDHLGHEPRDGVLGAETRVQHPRGE